MDIIVSTRFKKDYKKAHKRGKNIDKLNEIIDSIANTGQAPASTRPHILVGDLAGFWECHIESDWLLIYEIADNEIILRRVGTHSDLFKK